MSDQDSFDTRSLDDKSPFTLPRQRLSLSTRHTIPRQTIESVRAPLGNVFSTSVQCVFNVCLMCVQCVINVCRHTVSRDKYRGSGIRVQCVAACCSVLQCVAVCCSVLQCVIVDTQSPVTNIEGVAFECSVLQRVAVCCSVLQSVAECCSV